MYDKTLSFCEELCEQQLISGILLIYLACYQSQFSIFFWANSEQQKLQEAESLARQYLEQEERKKEEKKRLEQEAKEEIRRQLLKEMEEKAVREAREDKRVSSWGVG